MNLKIPVFLASDDNYSPFVATTMFSILEHTTSFAEFYILDGGIIENSKKLIEKSLEKFNNFSIEYIDMLGFGLERFPNLKHYSLNTFSRYFIPQIKPDLKKVLYLDIDIIANGDIAELYNSDLENYPLGAVLEDFYGQNALTLKEKIYPKFASGKKYFNAGVLVLNLEYFRQNNMTQKLVDKTIELSDVLACPDQDIFNIFFENNYKVLDYKFNFMPDHFEMLKDLYPQRADNIKKNAVLIHYTARKPWRFFSNAMNEFWLVAKNTAFLDKLIKDFDFKFLQLKAMILFLPAKILGEKADKIRRKYNIIKYYQRVKKLLEL